MDLGLVGKVVLISGSYRGTGAGTAKILAEEGATVAVHGHEEGQAKTVVEEIRSEGGQAIAVHGSLLTTESVESIVSDIEQSCGPIDVLVNNYGAPARTTWSDPAEGWHDAWETNVVSGVRLTQRVLPAMKKRGWGRIIFLGTIGTEKPGRENPDYYASKAALPVTVRSLV
ncbi:MAG: SDR family NAD(P)-dependent oxidoreductase [Candidatus Poriferisodalaceae bacterium]